ncbi:hypothetical protein PPTG_24980 [Phytophthora nicotianae INRA-310]|uniref:Uncharacterized protein n=1 Tax=Phytophthora nicotianae (strain INRA-310) TaxID=761204 RepID=W2PBM6_PHYN3|nr:hypothetical protein PPTG_24980 [Phytophthora nicotianae INRA-310]ETM97384.1 hypothetical protein PPTG_24980 [Phytophthora nicotianae INRA-310]
MHSQGNGPSFTLLTDSELLRISLLLLSQPPQPDPSLFGKQTFDKVHESGQQKSTASSVHYHHHHTPAKSWGYAGMCPYK